MPSSGKTSPRVTLTDLSSEILSVVARSLDVPSALSFARVAPGLAPHTDQIIWRKLQLVFRDDSDYDLYRMPGRPGPTYAVNMVEQAHTIGIRKKVKAVLKSGDARRWRMVEEVALVPRSGATAGMIEVLYRVSANLRSLAIRGPRSVYDFPITRFQALDLQLLDDHPGLRFPKLEYIRLGWESMFYISFIAYLCRAAPNLQSLEIYYHAGYHEDLRPHSLLRYPHSFKQGTSLRRVYINHRVDNYNPRREYDSWADLMPLLTKSPCLEQLVIIACFDDYPEDLILRAIAELGSLRDLYWASPDMYYETPSDVRPHSHFPSLRRLVTLQLNWELPQNLGSFPTLELLFCDRAHLSWSDRDGETIFVQSSAPQHLPTAFADWLRTCPCLRHIHTFRDEAHREDPNIFSTLDKISSSEFTGTIQSLRRGEDELLHVRLLVQDIEVQAPIGGVHTLEREWWRVIYTAGQDADFDRLGIRYKEPVIQVLTDYDGLIVPLKVVDEMRVVEGIKADEGWDRRGVEVGDAAWEVLLKWRGEQEGGEFGLAVAG